MSIVHLFFSSYNLWITSVNYNIDCTRYVVHPVYNIFIIQTVSVEHSFQNYIKKVYIQIWLVLYLQMETERKVDRSLTNSQGNPNSRTFLNRIIDRENWVLQKLAYDLNT